MEVNRREERRSVVSSWKNQWEKRDIYHVGIAFTFPLLWSCETYNRSRTTPTADIAPVAVAVVVFVRVRSRSRGLCQQIVATAN